MQTSELNITTVIAEQVWYHLENRIVEKIKQHTSKILEALILNDWITKEKAMELLDVKNTTFHELCSKGKFDRSFVSDRTILYSRKSILKYIDSQRV